LLEEAGMVSTSAITIGAPASAVWPWLVQIGPGRGGAYTYDWIENLLGLHIHSVDRIVPGLQHLEVGDVLPMMPAGPGMRVEILEPERVLSFQAEDGKWVWTFALVQENGRSRLISRNRFAIDGASRRQRFGMLAMEPASLLMESKCSSTSSSGLSGLPPSKPDAVSRNLLPTGSTS
jgi:hypothetical protein